MEKEKPKAYSSPQPQSPASTQRHWHVTADAINSSHDHGNTTKSSHLGRFEANLNVDERFSQHKKKEEEKENNLQAEVLQYIGNRLERNKSPTNEKCLMVWQIFKLRTP